MAPECPELAQCRDRRVADAEHRGQVMAMLSAIKGSIGDLWQDMQVQRNDIKGLYFKIGLISGGTSLIVSLVVSLIVRGIK